MTIAKRNEIRNFVHATGLNKKLLQTGALQLWTYRGFRYLTAIIHLCLLSIYTTLFRWNNWMLT